MSRPAGHKMPEETKAKISAAAIARFKEKVANPPERPETKQCTNCYEFKPLAAFYTKKSYRPLSGVTTFYPENPCKVCRAKADKLRRDRYAIEGKTKKTRKPTEQDARRHRENLTARRRKAGMEPREFKEPREREKDEIDEHRVAAAPLRKLLERELKFRDITTIAGATGIGQRRIHGILRGEYSTVLLATVDTILDGLGKPEEMHFLYPDTSVGWHYVIGEI